MSNMNGQDKVSEKLFEIRKMLSISEASIYTGLSKSMLYKHKMYKIPTHSSTGGPNGKLAFNKDDLDKWWDERKRA